MFSFQLVLGLKSNVFFSVSGLKSDTKLDEPFKKKKKFVPLSVMIFVYMIYSTSYET
jgi:hypothetical protein